MFEKLKHFYNLGLYTAEQLYKFVERGIINDEEYREITESR